MSKFVTRNNHKSFSFEENWIKLKNFQLVRPLTLEQQIDRFQAAGLNYEKLAGLGVYDFNESQPLDDDIDDPTREPDYDLIDAATAMRDLQLKQQRQAAEAAGAEAQPMGSEKAETKEVKKTEVTDKSAARGEAAPGNDA